MKLLSQKFTNPVVGNTLIGLETADSSQFLNVFLPKFVGLLLVVGSLSFFFMFMWGAIEWILSGGDKAKLESSKSRITNALIGIFLLFIVFAIIELIETFFEINILTIDMGPLTIE